MTLLSVPDISCNHCKASITSALSALAGTAAVNVDLAKREVQVEGSTPASAILAALDQIGFPASVISAS
jgi:copper chaperone